jgi:hypothetical protein
MTRLLLSVAMVVAALGAACARAQTASLPLLSHLPSLGAATASTRDNPFFAPEPSSRLAFADPAAEPRASPGQGLRFSSDPITAAIRGLGAAFSGLHRADAAAGFVLTPGPDAAAFSVRPAPPRSKLAPNSLAARGGLDLNDRLTWKFADGLHYTFSDNLVGTLGYVGAHADRVRFGFTYRF